MSILVDNLRLLVDAAGSEKKLAELVGGDQSRLNRILRSETKHPRDDTLEPYAKKFALSIEQLKRARLTREHISGALAPPSPLDPETPSQLVRSNAAMVTSAARIVFDVLREWRLEVSPADGAELVGAAYEDIATGKSLEAAADAVRGMLRAFSKIRGQRVTG